MFPNSRELLNPVLNKVQAFNLSNFNLGPKLMASSTSSSPDSGLGTDVIQDLSLPSIKPILNYSHNFTSNEQNFNIYLNQSKRNFVFFNQNLQKLFKIFFTSLFYNYYIIFFIFWN